VETSSIERASVDSKSVENEIAVTKTKPPVSQQQCGAGLIVNAKLARFIQEQASQVKARQNSMLSSAQSVGSAGGGAVPRVNNSSVAHPRSMLRKELPPRFLRRLQAEQLERGSPNGSADLESMDQPAPLAMKESEGNFSEPLSLPSETPLSFPTVSTMISGGPMLNGFSMSRPPPGMMPPPFSFSPICSTSHVFAGSRMHHHPPTSFYPPALPHVWTQPLSPENWYPGQPMFSPQKHDPHGFPVPPMMMWHSKRPPFMPIPSPVEYPVSAGGGLYGTPPTCDEPNRSGYP